MKIDTQRAQRIASSKISGDVGKEMSASPIFKKGVGMTLIRISPDGKEIKHLYDEDIVRITSETSDIKIKRASDVFFDNDIKKWKIRVVDDGRIVNMEFDTRSEAIGYEVDMLEKMLRMDSEG